MYTLFVTFRNIIELILTLLIFCIAFVGYHNEFSFYLYFSYTLLIIFITVSPIKWNYHLQYYNNKYKINTTRKYPPNVFDFFSVIGIYLINTFVPFSKMNVVFAFAVVLCVVKILSIIECMLLKTDDIIFDIHPQDKYVKPWYILRSNTKITIDTYFKDAAFAFLIIGGVMISLTTPTNHSFLKEEYSTNIIYFELVIYLVSCIFDRLFYYYFDIALYQLVIVVMALFSGFISMIGESIERVGSVFAVIELLQVMTLGFVNNGIPGFLCLKYNNYLVVILFFGVPCLVFGTVYYCISQIEWEIPLILFYTRYVIAEILVSIAFMVKFETIYELLKTKQSKSKCEGKVVNLELKSA